MPLPFLMRPDGACTPALVEAQWLLPVLVALAAILWLWRGGRAPTALRGWVGVGLFLSAYDVMLNATAGRGSSRGGGHACPCGWRRTPLLDFGCTWAVLTQLLDVESYADTQQVDLSRAVTPDEVATVLCADAVALSGAPHAVVLSADGGAPCASSAPPGTTRRCARIKHLGWDAPLPGPRAVLTGRPSFLSSKEDVHSQFPGLVDLPKADAATAAVLPIRVSGEAIGTLVVWGAEPSTWTRSRRERLLGLAAQGGQAIARAQAYDDQVTVANTLQESLLPSRLPCAGTSWSTSP